MRGLSRPIVHRVPRGWIIIALALLSWQLVLLVWIGLANLLGRLF